jgi:glutamate transport system permease protein
VSNAFATDELGPIGRRRVRIATVASLVALAGVVAVALLRLQAQGQLEAELYTELFQSAVFRRLVWEGFILTNLRTAVVALVLSFVIGLALALARLTPSRIVNQLAGAFVEFFRSVPVLLFIFLITFGLPQFGIDLSRFWFLVIALTCYHSAVLAEVFRAGIVSLPRGQSEAATAIGLRYGQSMRLVIVPQAIRRMTPAIVSQLVTIIKDTTLGYIVGGGFSDILRQATQISQFLDNQLQTFSLAMLVVILTCLALSRVAARLEARQRRRFGASSVAVGGGPEDLMATGEGADEVEAKG